MVSTPQAGADRSTGAVGTSSGLRAAIESPVAPRGGVLMLPLEHGDENAPWPAHVPLMLAEGSEIEGTVLWIETSARAGGEAPTHGQWTSDPRGLAARPVTVTDRVGDGGRAFLLARLPVDASGPIQLGDQTINPIWRDLPTRAQWRNPDRPVLVRTSGYDRPDPDSPFEHWRWVLLAERLDHVFPDLDHFDPAVALLAEHLTNLWHIGLARLEAESFGLAQHVRDVLTRLCRDDYVTFAAWVADPARTDGLLAALLNPRRRGDGLTSDVLGWLDEQERVRVWIESDAGRRIRLALVNPGFRPAVVRFGWHGDEHPLAVEVAAGTLRRVSIDRPRRELAARRPLEHLMHGERDLGSHLVLQVESDGLELAIPFGPPAAVAQPPGIWLPIARPPLSLVEIQGGHAPGASPGYGTIANVRRLRGRWEVLIEASRPHVQATAEEKERRTPTSVDAARGVEAVILIVGEDRNTLIIPEHGWHHIARGSNDGSLQIHRQSYHDRWICRVVLPDNWLNTMLGEYTEFAVVRTRKGAAHLESTPRPMLPWRTDPGAIALDLSEWHDAPILGP